MVLKTVYTNVFTAKSTSHSAPCLLVSIEQRLQRPLENFMGQCQVVWLFESKGQFPAGCLVDFHDQFHRYKCDLEANLLWEQENWKNYQQKYDGFFLPRVEWDCGQHGVLPVVLVWDYHCVVFLCRPSNHKQSCSTHSYTLIPLFTGFNGIYCFRWSLPLKGIVALLIETFFDSLYSLLIASKTESRRGRFLNNVVVCMPTWQSSSLIV